MKNDKLGNRMKENYEDRSRFKLTRRTPVILRLDGKAFHTFTRIHCKETFDEAFINSMDLTAKGLLEQIQGAKLAYVQSDEISILVTDYDDIGTNAWFDYNIQKLTSVTAGYAANIFNYEFFLVRTGSYPIPQQWAIFDCRCFNIPKEEVMNYFIWRQKDCIRNSLYSYTSSFYSHKHLQNKNESQQHELLYQQGKNWTTDLSPRVKNGGFIYFGTDKTSIANGKRINQFAGKNVVVKYDDADLNPLFNF